MTDIFLRSAIGPDVILRDPTVADSGGATIADAAPVPTFAFTPVVAREVLAAGALATSITWTPVTARETVAQGATPPTIAWTVPAHGEALTSADATLAPTIAWVVPAHGDTGISVPVAPVFGGGRRYSPIDVPAGKHVRDVALAPAIVWTVPTHGELVELAPAPVVVPEPAPAPAPAPVRDPWRASRAADRLSARGDRNSERPTSSSARESLVEEGRARALQSPEYVEIRQRLERKAA